MAVGQRAQPIDVDRASGDQGVGIGAADEEFGGEAAGAVSVDLDGVQEEVAELVGVEGQVESGGDAVCAVHGRREGEDAHSEGAGPEAGFGGIARQGVSPLSRRLLTVSVPQSGDVTARAEDRSQRLRRTGLSRDDAMVLQPGCRAEASANAT